MPSDQPMPGRCGAKLRGERAGRFCTQRPRPNGRCKMHGGSAATGPANGSWKTGRYAKWGKLFGEHGKAIAEAAEDEQLLDLRKTLAVFQAGLADAAARMAEGDTANWRKRASALYRAAMDGGTQEMAELGVHLERGVEADEAFELVLARNEKLHKATSDTLDTLLRAANVLTFEQLTAFVFQLFSIIRAECEPAVHSRILARFNTEQLGGRFGARGVIVEPET